MTVFMTTITTKAMPRIRRLDGGISKRRPEFDPDQSVYDLWWINWPCDRFYSKQFGFPLAVSLYECSIIITHLTLTLTIDRVGK
jgi:hypothetical protein